MRDGKREIGCGLWLLWLFLALFAAEWLLLWLVIPWVPRERVSLAVWAIVVATIIGGSVSVYFRVQRRIG